MSSLGIKFGALSKPIAEQIADAGFVMDEANAERWQFCADAIVRLSLAGVLTDAAMHQARRRLMKRLVLDLRTP